MSRKELAEVARAALDYNEQIYANDGKGKP